MACHHMVSTQLSLEGLSKFVAVGVVVPIVVFVFIKLKVWRKYEEAEDVECTQGFDASC
jgi:hypothetical protein